MLPLLWLLLGLQTPGQTAAQADAAVKATVASPAFGRASEALDREFDRHVAETIQLTEIPAPPFKEAARAKVYLEMLKAAGLGDVEMDAEGNVMGLRRGTDAPGGPVVVMAAHLDTVFPEGTNVKVRREGTRLYAPGVGDDTRSLAVLLALVRAMAAGSVTTKHDILFVGNVGEEGLGDLRGTKYLFTKGKYKDRIKMFVSADGTDSGHEIVSGGVGSKRYRVTFKGPGGHSYSAFGLVSPAFAMANAAAKFGAMKAPASPKTTFNVGVVGGGTSVNSIPGEMWMEVDMRSESKAELDRIDATFKQLVADAVAEENAARSTARGKITADVALVGDRPTGATRADSPITAIAAASVRAFGLTPAFTISSTDSNVPMGLGIPAITLDAGGASFGSHALDEWIDVEKASSLRGMRIMLATLVTLAGLPL